MLISRLNTLLGGAILIVVILLLASCGPRVSKGDVYQRVSKELSLGASKAQVIAFVDTLEINGLTATHGAYITPYTDVRQPEAKGYMGACINGIGGGVWDSVCMMFYFDGHEKLINYQIDYFDD